MKYRRLTKEQFEELHQEFSKFLATQQIDSKEWNKIKVKNTELMEEELNLFSDLVWEDILTKTTFIEHISENDINLFKCHKNSIDRIYIKLNDLDRNFLNNSDFKWFLKNPLHKSIEYFKGTKSYSLNRNQEIFKLIEMGGILSNGKLFTSLNELIQ